MKTCRVGLALALISGFCMVAGQAALAAEKPVTELTSVAGTVSVPKDMAKDQVATFTTEGGQAYSVLRNAEGKDLAKLSGKTALVSGTIVTRTEGTFLKVTSCAQVIAGTVQTLENKKGNEVGVQLAAEDGTVYRIEDAAKGKSLESLLGKKVEVAGNVTVRKKGNEELNWVKVEDVYQHVVGTLDVTTKNGKVTGAKIVVDGVTYNVNMNSEGQDLASKLAGKKVDVIGTVKKQKKDEMELKVRSFKESA